MLVKYVSNSITSVCIWLGLLAKGLHEIVQSVIPSGQCTETLLKVLTRLYGTLTMLVKYVSTSITSICTRLGLLVKGLHEIVQSVIPSGQCTETLLKVLTRLYGTLTVLVKYVSTYITSICTRLGLLVNGLHEIVQSVILSGQCTETLLKVLTRLYGTLTMLVKYVSTSITSICTRLGLLVNGLHEIVQSVIPSGQCTETLLKVLTRLYGTLTMLVKYVSTSITSICTRLGLLVNCLHEIVQSVIPSGQCTETLLKVLTRLYGTLTMLVKYVSTSITSICTRLGLLVKGLHEIVQSVIPSGQCTETLLKVLTRLYGTLTVLVKYVSTYITSICTRLGLLVNGLHEIVQSVILSGQCTETLLKVLTRLYGTLTMLVKYVSTSITSICTRLGLLVNGLHKIVQSVIPSGQCTETLLKVLTRLYGTLTMLVKYVSTSITSICTRLGLLVNGLHEIVQSVILSGQCTETLLKVLTRLYGTLTVLVKYVSTSITSICTRLGLLVNGLHEIVQSVIPSGQCTETLLKVLTRLYGTLTMLVKYVSTSITSICTRLGKLVNG